MYYNRFRYYSPDEGVYISQDPIGLAGNNHNLYSYVENVNVWIDSLGLSSTALGNDIARGFSGIKPANHQAHHVIPEAVWNSNSSFLNDIGLSGQRDKAFNGISLPNSEAGLKGSSVNVYHRGSHRNYNEMMGRRVGSIRGAYENGLIDRTSARRQIRRLQMEMKNKIAMGHVATGHTRRRHSKRLH